MKITFYISSLCPRCRQAEKHLKTLLSDFPEIEIERVEVTRAPLRMLRDKVFFIPTLRSETETLSGISLSKEQLLNFLILLRDKQA